MSVVQSTPLSTAYAPLKNAYLMATKGATLASETDPKDHAAFIAKINENHKYSKNLLYIGIATLIVGIAISSFLGSRVPTNGIISGGSVFVATVLIAASVYHFKRKGHAIKVERDTKIVSDTVAVFKGVEQLFKDRYKCRQEFCINRITGNELIDSDDAMYASYAIANLLKQTFLAFQNEVPKDEAGSFILVTDSGPQQNSFVGLIAKKIVNSALNRLVQNQFVSDVIKTAIENCQQAAEKYLIRQVIGFNEGGTIIEKTLGVAITVNGNKLEASAYVPVGDLER